MSREGRGMRLPRWYYLLLIPVVLIAGVGAFYAMRHWRGTERWQEATDQLRAKGEPLTFEELFARPEYATLPEPSSEWKATLVPATADWWKDQLSQEDWFEDPDEVPLDEIAAFRDEIRAQLQTAEVLLGAANGPVNWDYDLSDPIALPLPHLGVMMALGKLLSLEARASLMLGESNAAILALQKLLRVESFTHRPSTLVEALVTISLQAELIGTIVMGIEKQILPVRVGPIRSPTCRDSSAKRAGRCFPGSYNA